MVPPLVDTHCHLLAGLDDGPKTPADAVAMCRRAYDQGVRHSVALAHQNDHYPDNTPDRLRAGFRRLTADLAAAGLDDFAVYPCAEIMVRPDLADVWDRGEFLTVSDGGLYALLEMPHGLCVELAWLVERLVTKGVRPILAHAERSPELLHDPPAVERLIAAGCLIQVSSLGVTRPASGADARAVKDWVRRGVAHVLGSDGHSPRRRPPDLLDAYDQIRRWAGADMADRIASTNGLAVVRNQPLRLPPVAPPPRRWLPRLW
ncbi:MAG TPA: CpsB/CapC family capsule biosynthesis tyrosine phosphatase [Gemmataceae bacterium]|jgi:protein-tyrosine phosphatase